MKKQFITPVLLFALFCMFTTGCEPWVHCQIDVEIQPSGAGTVTGAGKYPLWTEATLEAKANYGYGFSGWEIDGVIKETAPVYSFPVTRSKTVVARFEKTLDPNHPLAIFEQISAIPRCSKNEARISAWLVAWAEERGFQVKSDAYHNVLISVPAAGGVEDLPPVVLQAHMDMVCQKTEDSDHDFSKDPIHLIWDGDWLRADRTTLGADNGIGIAIALSLALDPGLQRSALELLFTTDEEQDMSGAANLSPDWLTGTKYINIDWETEGSIALGAAGGVVMVTTFPISLSEVEKSSKVFSLHIDGLTGGHSGVDIDKNRANANVLIARALSDPMPFRLIRFSGGSAQNAITTSSEIIFALSPDQVDAFQTRLTEFEATIREEYPNETGLTIAFTETDGTDRRAATEEESAGIVQFIMNIPQGVYEWSQQFPELPETSNNTGIVTTKDQTVQITTYHRSFDPVKLEDVTVIITTEAVASGGTSRFQSGFPAWNPVKDSKLCITAMATYEDLFQTPLELVVVHAGLECGYIADKYPGMEIISAGPTIVDVHTPRERLYIPSVDTVTFFLQTLLEDLAFDRDKP